MEEETISSRSVMAGNSFRGNGEDDGEIEENDLKVIGIFDTEAEDTFGRRCKTNLTTRNARSSAKIDEPRRNVVSLGEESAKNLYPEIGASKILRNRRIVEQNDGKFKMELCREFDEEGTSSDRFHRHSNKLETGSNFESMDLKRELPADTLVIKQCSRSYKDDSDYVRESTETSSGSSSATSGYRAQKVKRIQRAMRNKNRGNTEIRRNPMRVSKKEIDKHFPRQRQRLLAANRKGNMAQRENGKRTKSTTMPYMNTRSVTRKMYKVGATYQAPTKRDETEWKEWPVHGMHERPVYHPQAGLAVDYLGKSFTSLDGLSYREIISQPEIEIVSVDPRCDTPYFSDEKKQDKTQKCSTLDDRVKSTKTQESFATCMHNSLHSVLAYCSQVADSSYKQSADEKIKASKGNEIPVSKNLENEKLEGNVVRLNTIKIEPISKDLSGKDSKEISTASCSKNIEYTNKPVKPNILQSSDRKILAEKKSSNTVDLKNSQMNQLTLQEILQKPTKNVIFRKTSDSKIGCADSMGELKNKSHKPMTSDWRSYRVEGVKISDETLKDIAWMSDTLEAVDKDMRGRKFWPKGISSPYARKHVNRSLPLKYHDIQKETKIVEKVSSFDAKRADTRNVTSTATSGNVATWYTSDTSEISRILAEYNRNATKKAETQNYGCRNVTKIDKTNAIRSKNDVENIQGNCDLKFQQDKWRRCQFALNDTKNSKVLENVSVNNRQPSLENDEQTAAILTNDVNFQGKPKDSKTLNAIDSAEETSKMQTVHELLENTSLLYCAATGVHQDDLANYIDTLDTQQSEQWLETCDNSDL